VSNDKPEARPPPTRRLRGVGGFCAAVCVGLLAAGLAGAAAPAAPGVNDTCLACHGDKEAKGADGKSIAVEATTFAQSVHGEMHLKCTDCHEAHGTMNRPLLKKVNFEVCVGCHAEKRGPFLYEHASVKVEGCTACHSPHGTVEPHLLLRREGRFLCLQCHVNPSAANVPHSRLSFQTRGDCVRCHVQIHGSNADPFFLQ